MVNETLLGTPYVTKTGETIHIRPARPEDAAEVLVYIEQVAGESEFLTMGPGEFELTEAQESAYLAAVSQSSNEVSVLVFLGDELVALGNISARERRRIRHRGELAMSVRQAFWGRGIGALLLDHLVDWARENSVLRKLDLRVRSDNTKAIALYRKRGFSDEGLLRRQMRVEEIDHDILAMGRDVDGPSP